MAQVDFTNAVIEGIGDTGYGDAYRLIRLPNIGTYSRDGHLFNGSFVQISANDSISVAAENNYQKCLLYTGTFTTSGTEFYLYDHDTSLPAWKVSNISFNSGDTYRFRVDAVITSVR